MNVSSVMRGRIARKPFMLRFILCLLLAAGLFFFLSSMLDDKHLQYQAALLIMLAFVLAEMIYLLVLAVRRLHDFEERSWKVLLLFVPIWNIFWLIILLSTDGTIGPNAYGPDPKCRYSFFE